MTISKKRLEELKNISDQDIDTSDIPELDDSFWKTAKVIQPSNQKNINLCVDKDTLAWFKSQSEDYQSLINHALRSYAEKHEKP